MTDPLTDHVDNQTDSTLSQNEQKQRFFQRMSFTFMRRRAHMSRNAQIGFDECADFFVSDSTKNLRTLFLSPDNPLTFEIGFGMGHSLIDMAVAAPNTNFVGMEVHEPGLGLTAYNARKAGLTNLKIINGDAVALLEQLPENHIDTVQLYFPDPWRKKRHFKRRFVSHDRMALVSSRLKKSGIFHTATDWEHYAYWMLDVLDNTKDLENLSGQGQFHPRPDFRPYTKFEKRGIEKGHGVWDLIYRKSI